MILCYKYYRKDEEINQNFIEEKSMVLPGGDSLSNNCGGSNSSVKRCCNSSCRDPECHPSALPLSKLLSDNEIQVRMQFFNQFLIV